MALSRKFPDGNFTVTDNLIFKSVLDRGFPRSPPESLPKRDLDLKPQRCPSPPTPLMGPPGLQSSDPTSLPQGPVIYAQLDHSGGPHSDKVNKSESVVYADIRKN